MNIRLKQVGIINIPSYIQVIGFILQQKTCFNRIIIDYLHTKDFDVKYIFVKCIN